MRNSNKLLALALAAVLAFGSTTAALAADEDKDSAGVTAPISETDTNKTPAKDEDKKDDAAAPAGDKDKKDDAATPAGDEDKKDDAATPAGDEDKKDDAAAPAGDEDKKDDAAAPAGDEDKKDDAAAPAGDEDKKDDAAAPAMNYTDVTEKNWYYGAVSFVNEKKLMDGLTETSFGPSEDMTRQMLAVALYRLAGSPKVTAENPFTDVADNAAYKDAVVWAYSVEVVNGVTDTTFSPDSPVQRQAIATMLARYLRVDTSADGDVSAFKDADSIQSFAKGAMAWAASNELLQGNPDGTVNPRGNASRSAVATILQRFAPMAEGKAPTAGTDDTAAPADDTNKDNTPAPADDTNKDNAPAPADDTNKDNTAAPAGDTNKDNAPASASDTNKDNAQASADDTNKDDAAAPAGTSASDTNKK